MAIGDARDRPMQRRNAVQLRSVLTAAVVCAVLGGATFSNAHRDGSLANAMDPATRPILAKSISTVMKPSVERTRSSPEHFATLSEPQRLSALDMHKGQ
jgi:hypothetical protein